MPAPMSRILSLPEAVERAQELRAESRRLAFTNGVFDLLHAGHVDYLEKARALGDALFVGVNSDESARQLKGPGRPLVPAGERARLVAALRTVDAVIIFPEQTAENLIRALRPEVYAKGADYASKPLLERAAVEACGGRVELVPLLEGFSTTELIERIQEKVTGGT